MTQQSPQTIRMKSAIREMSITADLTAEQVIIPNNSVDGTVTLNLNGTQINMDLLNEMVGDVSVAPQRKKRSKEKELNPGDTKLLDEYLHSFMKGGC